MINKILVPIDFSESGEAGLEMACELARSADAELVVLHSDELPVMPMGEIVYVPSYVVAEHKQLLERRLAEVLERLQARGLRARTKLAVGPAFHAITEATESERPELLVMGTHGRRGLRRLALGSVAERVVRTSKVPVMTVKQPISQDKAAPT
jgi:nucleotide-binding universal stress UspA family protein